jgi:hypothetical protein
VYCTFCVKYVSLWMYTGLINVLYFPEDFQRQNWTHWSWILVITVCFIVTVGTIVGRDSELDLVLSPVSVILTK